MVVTWFSKVPLGQKLDKKVVLEEIGSGASFLVRGGGGWKAKVLLSCERECKKTINPEPVLCAPGTNFHTPKLVFVASVPDNWSLVCAFFHCLHSVCMLFACCLHVEVTLKSVLARKCTLDEAPVYIVVPKVTPAWFQHDLSMTSSWHQHSHRNIWAHMYVTYPSG